jgi:proline iminopeptidase
MKVLTVLTCALAALLLPAACRGQAAEPREGYIRTADGVRLFYKVVGGGPETLVAVHGGPGNTLESILPDLEPLAKNRRVIYYDQRGGGRSDLVRDRDKLAVAKHVADLEAVRTHFKLGKMTLLGNSWGGMLVSFYAAAHPDRVERMVLHNPGEPTKELAMEAVDEIGARIGSRYNAEQRKRFGFVSNPQNWVKAEDPRALCREWFGMLLPTYVSKVEKARQFKGDVCAGPEEAVRYQQVVNMLIWGTMGDWNVLPQLTAVKAPVLVIHGPSDPIPVESSEAWARGFPNARLLLVEGSGHLSHVEQPEVFFGAVETFLKGGWPTAARNLKVTAMKK